MKRLPIIVLLSALAVSAVACGGDDDDTNTAAESTAASGSEATTEDVPEFTEEQMLCPLDTFSLEAITGLVFLDPDPIIETGDGVSCTFGHESGELGIGVTTYGSGGAQAGETLAAIVDDAESVDVDFADEAIWSPSMTTLHVVKGDGGVQIQITDFTGGITDPLQVATELAEFAIG
jgi:hypothetical protein